MSQNVLCFHVPNFSQILSIVHSGAPASLSSGNASKCMFAKGSTTSSAAGKLLQSRLNYTRGMAAMRTTASALRQSYTEGCKNIMRVIQPVQELVQRFWATNFVLSWHNHCIDIRMVLDKLTRAKYAMKVVSKENNVKAGKLYAEAGCWQAMQDSEAAAKLEGIFEDHESMYFVYELCRGGDLQYLLETQGMMTEVEAAQVVHALLTLISECHEKGISFGPPHPDRLGLATMYPSWAHQHGQTTDPGEIKIRATDFAPSRPITKGEMLRQPCGSALYMAPEMLMQGYGTEADVWGVGVLMYQLLSGELPFCSALMHSHTQGQPPPDAILAAIHRQQLTFQSPAWVGVSPEAKDLISRMLQACPSTRITPGAALNHSWFKKLEVFAADNDRNITELSSAGFAEDESLLDQALNGDFLDPLDSLDDVAVCEIVDLAKSDPMRNASEGQDSFSYGAQSPWSLTYRVRLAAQLPSFDFMAERLTSPATVAMVVAMSGVYVLLW